MLKLWKYYLPYWGALLTAVVLLFLQANLELALPDYFSRIVNVGIQQAVMSGGEVDTGYILKTGSAMVLITFVSALAIVGVGYIAARTAAGVARNVRRDLFARVESFSSAEFDRFSTASLITRNTNDITQIQMVTFMMIRMVFYAPIMAAGGVVRALGKAPSMAWIIGLAVLLLLGLIIVLLAIAMPRFKLMQKLVDRVNKVGREQLTGLMVVRAFNRQEFETERFDKANRDLTENNLFIMRIMVLAMPAVMLIMNVLSVIVIWVGSSKVAASQMPIGDMMAFLQYATQIIMSFLMLSMMFIMLPRAAVSADRVAEVLRTEPAIKDPEAPENLLPGGRGILEFRSVNFTYPGAEDPALQNISFTARPGETTAVIGSTGSGKSTLVNLIPRFYDAASGSILLDGQDIRNLRQKDLRNAVGYVPQKASLFSGTMATNLRYGDEEAPDTKLEEAAETAQILDFIRSREEVFDSPVTQGGGNLSGGQKQRLSIARALVKPSKVLIFDDSFSALDFKTDAALRKALQKKTKDAAVFIVAQRVSTVMHAEQILVLDEGKLVGRGTHEELMKECAAYKEIVLSQLNMEEAENL